jgi:metal-responsive CopG/Arc/MetJ family transcriptional regulator
MKAKTSLTLSEDVLAEIDRLAGSRISRSSYIESILRRYLQERERAKRDARDLEILNRNADALNAEAEEVLEDQGSLE